MRRFKGWLAYRIFLLLPVPGTPWWVEKRLLPWAGDYALNNDN